MTDSGSFEKDGRAVPYAVEGDGPVSLVLLAPNDLQGDGLGVVAHYLAEEAGFQIVRIGSGPADASSIDDRVADAVTVAEHLEITDTWVGGRGFGGTIARQFAAAHHGRVNGLLLLGVEEVDIPLPSALPVLIIQGSDDEVTPPANGEHLRAIAPERTSVTTLDGADHQFPATHPVET